MKMTVKPALFRPHPTTEFTRTGPGNERPIIKDGPACWEIRCALDPEKMWAYDAYLEKYARDKVVIDVGSGSGIMGYLALKHGARKVIAIDYNEKYIPIVKTMLEQFGDRVEIGLDNARSFIVPPCDIIIHEIFGHNIFDEYVAQIAKNLASQDQLHKVVPKTIEWHEMYWKRGVSPGGQRAVNALEYVPDNFPLMVQEFFKEYDEKVESVNGISIQNIPYHNPEWLEHKIGKVIGKTDLTDSDCHNMVPPELRRVGDEDFDPCQSYAWFAYLDDNIGYGNYPRQGNNWSPMPADLNSKNRFLSEAQFRVNKNPLNKKSKECPFLK
jgi:hypothetical protein